MELSKFRALLPRNRALVAVGVLLDGHEAESFFASDAHEAEQLQAAAAELAALPPELRMPYTGSVLRVALKELR